ncbi:carboxylesterase family protein [Shewanella olleyana]|uniref:carboxylesterase family protein n=1 Tax=Shewanella olleyana TaxID=135626 RepID=UPI00200C60E2|nr:carboxylesterase family protein [Shewanella olleyana]MCL1067410.1 carboxylesterase family protein [Shewanella olleyana]
MKIKLLRFYILIVPFALLIGCSKSDSELAFTPDPNPETPNEEEVVVQAGDVTLLVKSEPVTVELLNNLDDGSDVTTATHYVEVIKGVPYAYAGEEFIDSSEYYGEPARFKHSAVLPFELLANETNFDATEFADKCVQPNLTDNMSENCLNLNIWRPAGTTDDADLPVYVYIHGGAFESGSGQEANIIPDVVVAQSISDAGLNIRTEPFIAITFNYRLGLLGSLWQEDNGDTKGGNFGVGDQKRALEWVNQYISLFGGNPDNVTVFGQGAGATSIHYLQQTPDILVDLEGEDDIAGKYFSKSIMQSTPYGVGSRSYELAEDTYATIYDYAQESYPDKDIQSLSIDELLDIQQKVKNQISGRLFGLPDGVIEDIIADIIESLENGDSTTALIAKLSLKYASTLLAIEPRSKLTAFQPYLESHTECIDQGFFGCKEEANYKGYHVVEQAVDTQLKVPSVVGFNSEDSNSFTAALKLVFIINIELLDGIKLIDVVLQLLGDSDDIRDLPQIPDIPAYMLLSSIMYADYLSDSPLNYADFSPALDDTNLSGITENMGKFNDLNNQLIYKCAARDIAKQNSSESLASLYHFDYKAGFNTNVVDDSIFGTIGNLSCFSGVPCNEAELPFVFNRKYNSNGNEIAPTATDTQLMATISRLWFTDKLFEDNTYNNDIDNVLMIKRNDSDVGVVERLDGWDLVMNAGIDENTMNGICEAIY